MDHSHDMKQVVLIQLLQAVGKLFHVHVLIPPVLLLRGVFATDTVRIGRARFLKQGK